VPQTLRKIHNSGSRKAPVARKRINGPPIFFSPPQTSGCSPVPGKFQKKFATTLTSNFRSKLGDKSLTSGSSIFDPSSRANASSGSAHFARVEAVSRRLPTTEKIIPPDLPNFQPACPKLCEKFIIRVREKPPSSETNQWTPFFFLTSSIARMFSGSLQI
jgi:hypothetical protein